MSEKSCFTCIHREVCRYVTATLPPTEKMNDLNRDVADTLAKYCTEYERIKQ